MFLKKFSSLEKVAAVLFCSLLTPISLACTERGGGDGFASFFIVSWPSLFAFLTTVFSCAAIIAAWVGGGGGGAKLFIWFCDDNIAVLLSSETLFIASVACDGLLLFLVNVGGLNGGGAFGSFALGFLGLENDPFGVIGGGGGTVLGGIVSPTNVP